MGDGPRVGTLPLSHAPRSFGQFKIYRKFKVCLHRLGWVPAGMTQAYTLGWPQNPYLPRDGLEHQQKADGLLPLPPKG